MTQGLSRRSMLKGLTVSAASLLSRNRSLMADANLSIQSGEIEVTAVSPHTLRITFLPADARLRRAIIDDGSLVTQAWPSPVKLRAGGPTALAAGNFRLQVAFDPLKLTISGASGPVQEMSLSAQGILSFSPGTTPLLGLGEGGPQFDRRGVIDSMQHGQGAYKLASHGARVPIPWIVSTSGWAIFFYQPFGTFDLSGSQGKFLPSGRDAGLSLDLFFVAAPDPATIMAEYARLTGYAEMPPLWSFGYQQSHRTLSSREEILEEAKTFRQKKLPCDALIYLGTGFCPSGWNAVNGSFAWNASVFPDPKVMLDELHGAHFHAVLHTVILAERLRGTVHDACELAQFDEESAACYWDAHRKDFAQGVDGWWPDEGDPLDRSSCLNRNRMYWEGPQMDRPNERPYALHRNGYAGMQRYGAFLWSGDVFSTWEALRTQVPIALNSGLSGMPFWGTDIGGFVPTPEFTAELYLRWFQFGAFCPLFRCHGRAWKLRLPWGWNTGDAGPTEIGNNRGASVPDATQLHDARVEPICRKYLELRYRMLPHLYSAVRECATTGMPIMRALWLHFPGDATAVARADEYLWGRDILVAPVTEKGAASRNVYLPPSDWYDFWSGERLDGGREITRPVDLETIPLYVRAGAIVPLGPVKQFVGEQVDEPLTVSVYPGADASFLLYEDDGNSFNYRLGEWMGIQMEWSENRRRLSLRLAEGSRMLPPKPRPLIAKLGQDTRKILFNGEPAQVEF